MGFRAGKVQEQRDGYPYTYGRRLPKDVSMRSDLPLPRS